MPTLYLAKFKDSNAVFTYGNDDEQALLALREAGITDTPRQLVEVPPGLFVAEVQWADDDAPEHDEDSPPNPANAALNGVAFEPFDALIAFLEMDEKATTALDAVGIGKAPTEPAPSEDP